MSSKPTNTVVNRVEFSKRYDLYKFSISSFVKACERAKKPVKGLRSPL
jgi:hypothetical protein